LLVRVQQLDAIDHPVRRDFYGRSPSLS
jgi:hypothetical protein